MSRPVLYEACYAREGWHRQIHFTARDDTAALAWASWWLLRFHGELLGLRRCRGHGRKRRGK